MKEMQKKPYRLGIDMGSTSIGWCMLELDSEKNPCGVINMGVRIFPDGRDDKSKEPLSVARRTYRGMRRNLDRYLDRRKKLIEFFDRNQFLPSDVEARKQVYLSDPYYLRAIALDRELSLAEFARAILHLAQRRGFKSNRKETASERDTKLTEAMQNLQTQMQENNSRTLGEYLYNRNAALDKKLHHQKKSVKFRYEKGLSDEERIFPTREMVEAEFELLWETQKQWHPELDDILKAELHKLIFHQRSLKAQKVGKCTLEPDEERCHKAYPLFQEARLRADINHLKLVNVNNNTSRDLTSEQREMLFNLLNEKDTLKFEALRSKLLGKEEAEIYRFNSETDNKKTLQGNLTNHAFSKKKELYSIWKTLSDTKKNQIVDILLNDELSDEAAMLALQDAGLTDEQAGLALDVHLPADHGNLSVKALSNILPYLRQGAIYSQACESVGYKHSGDNNGEVFDEGNLPYYGELLKKATLPLNRNTPSFDDDADKHGKINNPTVHIALNQLRKLVNALSKKYGAPEQICLELARETAPPKKLVNALKEQLGIVIKAYDKEPLYHQYRKLTLQMQKKNTEENQFISQELSKISVTNNYENRIKYKLWAELSDNLIDRRCVYCGRQISQTELYRPDIHIEHILPKSRTYDDSINNKTIAHLSCNDDKGERSPYEAFGNQKGKYDWEAICQRANNLPAAKRWRFREDAMQQFEDENKVLDRMLNDTRYMTRVAREYMMYVAGKDNVIVCSGKLTEVLRRKWKLNDLLGEGDKKERTDHRHHAIDAFVIAMTTRSMVKRFMDAAKKDKEDFWGLRLRPYPTFNKDEMQDKINRILVSYKPDQVKPQKLIGKKQTAGGLSKETAYSYIGQDPDNPKFCIYCVRQDVTTLSAKNIADIKDLYIREKLQKLLDSFADEKEFKQKLPEWAKSNNIKKVKVLEKANPATMIPVKDKNGRIYKYYASDENLYADIYNPKPFDPKSKWEMEIVKSFDAHQKDFVPIWKRKYPMAKLIMRLYKHDIVAYNNEQGNRELRRVRKMSDGKLYLRELNIVKKPKEIEDKGEAFYVYPLQQKNACKAGIDIIGRCFDPGGKTDAGDRA